jgi:DnaJ-class molecular chaperone
MQTYYEILEVSELASVETIRAAFRALSKRYHPDNKKTGNAEKFRLLSEAHEHLVDAEKRKHYDSVLLASRKPPTRSKSKKATQPAFDPEKGVEALFTLGNVALRHYGVDPMLVSVITQVQPDLEKLAVEGIKRVMA